MTHVPLWKSHNTSPSNPKDNEPPTPTRPPLDIFMSVKNKHSPECKNLILTLESPIKRMKSKRMRHNKGRKYPKDLNNRLVSFLESNPEILRSYNYQMARSCEEITSNSASTNTKPNNKINKHQKMLTIIQ